MNQITVADIDAMCDVLNDLAEVSDELTLEDAMALKAALGRAKTKIDEAIGLLRTQAITVLDDTPEHSAVVGSTKVTAVPTGKWRPDQAKIRRTVAGKAAYNGNGEPRPPFDAAEEAVRIMYRLFVSPQTFPKTGGLEELGFKKSDVGEFERTGTELKETPL